MPDETAAARTIRLRAELRPKALEHLEAALACMDQTQDGTAAYLIERAMDEIRQAQWPALDPRADLTRKS